MPSANELKEEGNKAFSSKEYKKAAKIYRDAIRLDPGNPVLYSNRAICFLKQNDWERALKDCESGIQLKPDFGTKVKLLFRKGLAYKNMNRLIEAQDVFNEILKIDASNISAIREFEEVKNKEERKKKVKLNNNILNDVAYKIPIIEVDQLPDEYKLLLVPTPEKNSNTKIEPSLKAKNEIESIFERKQSLQAMSGSNFAKSDRSVMHYLSSLKSLSESQKLKAYKYVVNMNPTDISNTFKSSGIELEFLEFFLEASDYVAKHNVISDWQNRILASLIEFSKLPRYQLSLSLCNSHSIESLLESVNKLDLTNLHSSYLSILNWN